MDTRNLKIHKCIFFKIKKKMNYNDYIYQLKKWKSDFPKDKSYIEKIASKIDNQIKLEEEITQKENLKIEKISYAHYNRFFHDKEKTEKVFLKLTEKEELNHVINFYYNVTNRLNFFFPSFYPFFYGYLDEDRNTLLFENIFINDTVSLTLKEALPTLDTNTVEKIYKVIFYQLQILSTFFSFCHYNLKAEDFLLIPVKNSVKNYYINTICDENKSINELYQYINYEEIGYIIKLNVFSENIKNCYFKVNQKTFYFVTKKDIKINMKNNIIRIDRTNILTDIFSLLKNSLECDINNVLLKRLFRYFITDFPVEGSIDSKYFDKIENFLDFGNNYLSFDAFISLFDSVEKTTKQKEYPVITRHDVMLDFIEVYNTEMCEEEEFYINTLENYIKNFNSCFFLKNLKEFSDEIEKYLLSEGQLIEGKHTEFIKYIKINFYIFCKLKNYFFQQEEEKESFITVQKIFKENLISVYNIIKKKSNGQLS